MENKENKNKDEKGRFIVGHTPWHKGKTNVYSEKTKELWSEQRKGKEAWNKGLKGQTNNGGFKKGHKHSTEVLKKISDSQKARNLNGKNNPFYGKRHTMETREKIKEARAKQTIKPHTKEAKNKISLGNKGKKLSEETKQKIREARLKQIFPEKDTKIEVKIQSFLKKLGIEFYTHQIMNQIKHKYQCDILIPSMNMVIECDGDYWHKYPVGNDLDHIRTKELIEKGFKVLRLWEHQINNMELKQFQGILNEN